MLSLETLAAYCRTSYRVDAPGRSFVLRVGERHPEFDQHLELLGVDSWAFVTAWNPRSMVLSSDENAARHGRFVERLAQHGLRTWPGAGEGDAPGWAPERSLCLLGVTSQHATELAAEFDQHALVVGCRGEPAELRFPFWPEVEATLQAALTSDDAVVRWTAERALAKRG